MVDLRKIPVRDKKGDVYVVVETPRGSAAKLEFDPGLQLFTLSKSLILGLSYPTTGVSFHPPRVKTAIPYWQLRDRRVELEILKNSEPEPVFPAQLEILKNWIPRTAFEGGIETSRMGSKCSRN
jgi:hypothetical protein